LPVAFGISLARASSLQRGQLSIETLRKAVSLHRVR
jgi:hypothetical protein